MKFIIFGFKMTNGNSYRYIHQGYFKAAETLGYETYWLDNFDTVNPSFLKTPSFLLKDGRMTTCLYVKIHFISFIILVIRQRIKGLIIT